MKLNNKIVIITGGGRGIGQKVAKRLALEGAYVNLLSRTEKQLRDTKVEIDKNGGRACIYPVDVTDNKGIIQTVETIINKVGSVDILINNAGIEGPCGPVWEIGADEWWKCVDVNLRGAFLCIHAVLPYMISQKQGRIINMASITGEKPYPFNSAYSLSKMALIRLSEILALESQQFGIKVFSIHPGRIDTSMTRSVINKTKQENWWAKIFISYYSKSEYVTTELVENLIIKLAMGEADSLSGHFITVFDDISDMINRINDRK